MNTYLAASKYIQLGTYIKVCILSLVRQTFLAFLPFYSIYLPNRWEFWSTSIFDLWNAQIGKGFHHALIWWQGVCNTDNCAIMENYPKTVFVIMLQTNAPQCEGVKLLFHLGLHLFFVLIVEGLVHQAPVALLQTFQGSILGDFLPLLIVRKWGEGELESERSKGCWYLDSNPRQATLSLGARTATSAVQALCFTQSICNWEILHYQHHILFSKHSDVLFSRVEMDFSF